MQVLRDHSCDDLIADYCDGTLYQTHPVSLAHENALQIIAYSDEVEVCNTLGSHAATKN